MGRPGHRVPVARKPIQTSVEFEARLPVKGRVLWAVMCDHCESEGELRIRMARDPTKGWDYRLADKETFVDVHAVDATKVYDKVRAGEWVAGHLIVLGSLKRRRSGRVGMEGSLLADGARLVGQVSLGENHAEVDFGLFKASLRFESAEQMQRVLKYEKIRDGTLLATDVNVDLKVERWGRKQEILHGKPNR